MPDVREAVAAVIAEHLAAAREVHELVRLREAALESLRAFLAAPGAMKHAKHACERAEAARAALADEEWIPELPLQGEPIRSDEKPDAAWLRWSATLTDDDVIAGALFPKAMKAAHAERYPAIADEKRAALRDKVKELRRGPRAR